MMGIGLGIDCNGKWKVWAIHLLSETSSVCFEVNLFYSNILELSFTGGAGYVFSRETMIELMPHYYPCMIHECDRNAEVLNTFAHFQRASNFISLSKNFTLFGVFIDLWTFCGQDQCTARCVRKYLNGLTCRNGTFIVLSNVFRRKFWINMRLCKMEDGSCQSPSFPIELPIVKNSVFLFIMFKDLMLNDSINHFMWIGKHDKM
jgi:hypothetical protein